MTTEEIIELVLASPDNDLRARVRACVDTQTFHLTEVSTPFDALSVFSSLGPRRAILAVTATPPAARNVQELVDVGDAAQAAPLCATQSLDRGFTSALLAIGIQEVIELRDLTPERLSAALFASSVRDQHRRELVRLRNRALLKRDIVAAIAACGTRHDIYERFLDGLMALGASGAVCCEMSASSLVVAHARGSMLDCEGHAELSSEAAHPAVLCARSRSTQWYSDALQLEREFADFAAATPAGSVGFVPVMDGTEVAAVIAIAHAQLPPQEELHALEQLCCQVGEALRRAALQTTLLDEREADRLVLGIIGHDLRNPLNTIQLGATLLAQRLKDGELEIVKRITRATSVALRLIQDLLVFSRVSAAGLELNLETANVFELLLACVEDSRLRAIGKREVVLQLESDVEEGVAVVDALRIEQAVGNVLSNALTYSSPGSRIDVRASSDAHALYIDIENRGGRIQAGDVAKLFEQGARFSNVTEHGSLGLGLFIVERIIAAHGGRIWVEQPDEDGVRFCIQLLRHVDTPQTGVVSVSPARSRSSQPPPLPPIREADLQALADALPTKELRDVLTLWATARGKQRLPHPSRLPRSHLLGYMANMVTARVALDHEGEPVFSWKQVGPGLERLLHGTLDGGALAASSRSLLSTQYDAYRRCWHSQFPVYDYANMRGDNGFAFSRLILPFSHDVSQSVTEIIAMVVFK